MRSPRVAHDVASASSPGYGAFDHYPRPVPVCLSTAFNAVPIFVTDHPAAQPVYFSNAPNATPVFYSNDEQARPVYIVPHP